MRALVQIPLLPRSVLIGAITCGIAGAIAGLVQGATYLRPTAWFAAIELGVPAAFAGALIGFSSGSLIPILRRHRGPQRRP